MKTLIILTIGIIIAIGYADQVHSIPAYNLTATNFANTTSNSFEFDIYIKHLPTVNDPVFNLSKGQYMFNFNPAFANGGTLTYSVVPGTTQLNTPPQFPVIFENQLRVTSALLSGTNIISTTGDGTRIARMRLTTTTSFTCTGPNLQWRNKTSGGLYTKIISADEDGIGSNITPLINPNHFIIFNNVSVTPSLNNYPTLAEAFTAINNGSHGNGAIAVNINRNTLESVTPTLNGNVFTSCIIRPTSNVLVSISPCAVSLAALILLDGADNVTVDGRIGGTGPIQLTLDANNFAQGCIKLINGASVNNIKYVSSIRAVDKNIFLAETNSAGNDNNIFENNIIENGNRGISLTGNSDNTASIMNTGNKILFNEIKQIKETAIQTSRNTQDNKIEGNQIHNESITTASIFYAINCQGVGVNNILRNKIYKIKSAGSGTQYSGIRSVPIGNISATVNIINNFISIVDDNSGLINGIYCSSDKSQGYVKQTTSVNHNTVFLGKESTSLNISTSGIKMNIEGVVGNESVYNQFNNISINERTIVFLPQHAFEYEMKSGVNVSVDYNCYWSNNLIAWWKTTNSSFRNLPDYQCAANPQEQNTIFKDVNLVNELNGDLHLINISSNNSIGDHDLIGKPGLGITNDIDDALPQIFVRNIIVPYMGADEANEFEFDGTIRIKAFIDGYKVPGSSPVNVTVEIWDSDGSIVYSQLAAPYSVTLGSSGTATIDCHNAISPPHGKFHILIKRPGCLDTWSKDGEKK